MNWITLIAAILIIFLIVDGLRRARNSRNGKIRISPNMKKRLKNSTADTGDDAEHLSELPNGGARVVSHFPNQPSSKQSHRNRRSAQASLNLDEPVPILMEEVSDARQERIEPVFSQQPASHYENEAHDFKESDYLDDESDPLMDKDSDTDEYERDYAKEYSDDDAEDSLEEENYSEDNYSKESYSEDSYSEDDYDEDDYLDDELEDDEYEDDEPLAAEPITKAATPPQEPEEVLVINVMAPANEMLNGGVLLDALLQCGMRYGDMDIFHRYSDIKGEGALLFSMANMVKPGTFDLDTMDEFETPGICLFMTLPLNADSMQSFELMVNTASTLAQKLGGELKDEQRSVMTKQTIEHCRQRILDFERRRLFQRKR